MSRVGAESGCGLSLNAAVGVARAAGSAGLLSRVY